ncbi:solute carrier organic anion transporter family member 4A1-like [Ctenocephalides felis]|uniref:solute carrier organic anion transporter family member 4A1-like n=1 Tax=Ctenocephalides felis TaxID=7515 RepID=UPI000E6E3433|nr:solute carrier organic anion transporter family member 4A1-like [Ctenocephalides felis]
MGPNKRAISLELECEIIEKYEDGEDVRKIGLTPQSNVWIGAWWIGFIFGAIICFLLALPIIAYPSSLPGSEELRNARVSEAHARTGDSKEGFGRIRELPRALMELVRNPAFSFLNLAGASEGLLIAGFAAFLPKLIEFQFSVTPTRAALLMGLITVPAGGGGTFLGGYLVKRFSLSCSGIIKLCVVATAAGILFTFCFLLNCPNQPFAGVTVPYSSSLTSDSLNISSLPLSLSDSCNSGCDCSRADFDPICGFDQVMYYSPCHAGCTQEDSHGNIKVYSQCRCINSENRKVWKQDDESKEYDAANVTCDSTCPHLPLFVGLMVFVMFFTFLSTMPALSATLRCVRDEQRSFALGIQWIVVRLLGTIPAPMLFGALIDESCILWQGDCDSGGACLVYDNKNMSRYMVGAAFIGKACSLIFFFAAWWFYIPPKAIKPQAQNELPMNGNLNHVAERDKY